jgi:hypothetical protein
VNIKYLLFTEEGGVNPATFWGIFSSQSPQPLGLILTNSGIPKVPSVSIKDD